MNKLIVGMLMGLATVSCASEQAITPREQEEQETRMRNFLNDSSPREMSDNLKVTPEFRKNIYHPGPAVEVPSEEQEQEPYRDRPTAEGDMG